jgi:hypothetical protein
MIIVAVLSAIFAWIGSQWQSVCQRNKLFASLNQTPGLVWGTEQYVNPSPALPWLRQFMGDRGVTMIAFWHGTEEQAKAAAAVFPEARVTIGGDPMSSSSIVINKGIAWPDD